MNDNLNNIPINFYDKFRWTQKYESVWRSLGPSNQLSISIFDFTIDIKSEAYLYALGVP